MIDGGVRIFRRRGGAAVADRDLRRLSRRELIEIIYALKEKEEALTKENEDLRAALSDRKIAISKAGSIAEAALALNDIFAQAQAAADIYLASVRAAAEDGTLDPPAPAPEPVIRPEEPITLPDIPEEQPPQPEELSTFPDYGLDPSLLPEGDLWDYSLLDSDLGEGTEEPFVLDNWSLSPLETGLEYKEDAKQRQQRFSDRLSGLIQHPTGRKPE